MLDTITSHAASLGIGTYYLRYYAIYAAVLVAIVTAVRLARRVLPDWFATTAHLVVGIALVRVALFGNPLALRVYQRFVTVETAGPRQWAVLDLDIAEYRRDLHPARLENLAVGSSQVGAIFSHWVSNPPQSLRVYSMAGMKGIDYYLYREEIAAYQPDRIILYLSSFDLTAGPELYSLPFAPPHPTRMWSTIQRLRAAGVPADVADGPIHSYVASQLFPEYRYAFLYKAFMKPFFGETAQPAVARLAPQATPEPHVVLAAWSGAEEQTPPIDTDTQRRIDEFVGYHYPEWVDYNFGFLKEFIRFCRDRGLTVVIAEGQVNPIVHSPKVAFLDAVVRSRFAELELQFSNLTFIPATDTVRFVPSDYVDLTHVRREAAMRYTAQLSTLLGATAAPVSADACGVTFLSGWHGMEKGDEGWLRWSDGSGQLRITAGKAMDLVLEGQLLSLVRPNVVDLTVDGVVSRSLNIEDKAWQSHALPQLPLHLQAGQRVLVSFESHSAPMQLPNDGRNLTVAVKNLSVHSADGTMTCELLPDAPKVQRVTSGI